MLIFCKTSLAITDFLAKKTQIANYCGKPPLGNPPFAIPKSQRFFLSSRSRLGYPFLMPEIASKFRDKRKQFALRFKGVKGSCFFELHFPSNKVFVSQERVSGFPDRGADLWGTSREPLDCSYDSYVPQCERLPGKSPENFWGSSGNFWGSPGNFQKLGGA